MIATLALLVPVAAGLVVVAVLSIATRRKERAAEATWVKTIEALERTEAAVLRRIAASECPQRASATTRTRGTSPNPSAGSSPSRPEGHES